MLLLRVRVRRRRLSSCFLNDTILLRSPQNIPIRSIHIEGLAIPRALAALFTPGTISSYIQLTEIRTAGIEPASNQVVVVYVQLIVLRTHCSTFISCHKPHSCLPLHPPQPTAKRTTYSTTRCNTRRSAMCTIKNTARTGISLITAYIARRLLAPKSNLAPLGLPHKTQIAFGSQPTATDLLAPKSLREKLNLRSLAASNLD
jgi:hypothetical protein